MPKQIKIGYIINGKSKGIDKLKKNINEIFNAYKISFFITSFAGEAVLLSKKVINDNYDFLIIVGGDGSINEVVNGCMSCEAKLLNNAVIGVIPNGTGNDFAKSLGATNDLKKLKTLIENRTCYPIDVGKLDFINTQGEPQSRYFMNITDIGIGGVAAKILSNSSRNFGPKITYHKAILQSFLSYKPVEVNLNSYELNWKGKILSLCMANGNYFANGMCIAPQANLSDGKIQLIIMGKVSIWDYLKNLSKVKKGIILDHPEISYLKVNSCTIDAKEKSCPIDMDGEFIGYAPLKLTMINKGLNFLTEIT